MRRASRPESARRPLRRGATLGQTDASPAPPRADRGTAGGEPRDEPDRPRSAGSGAPRRGPIRGATPRHNAWCNTGRRRRTNDTGRTPAGSGGRSRSVANPRCWPRSPRTGRSPRTMRRTTRRGRSGACGLKARVCGSGLRSFRLRGRRPIPRPGPGPLLGDGHPVQIYANSRDHRHSAPRLPRRCTRSSRPPSCTASTRRSTSPPRSSQPIAAKCSCPAPSPRPRRADRSRGGRVPRRWASAQHGVARGLTFGPYVHPTAETRSLAGRKCSEASRGTVEPSNVVAHLWRI